ncbi:unnamed protein product [Caretta caretta]
MLASPARPLVPTSPIYSMAGVSVAFYLERAQSTVMLAAARGQRRESGAGWPWAWALKEDPVTGVVA